MKYEAEILAAFERLGYAPRPGQMEAVNDVISAFLDAGMENVVLCAPTGTGKSIIGAAIAEVLTHLGGDTGTNLSSIALTATNVLANQYASTFERLGTGKYTMMKGANNYSCDALSQPGEPETGEACSYFTMLKSGEFKSIIAESCDRCEFLLTKRRKNSSRHLSTNYSYFFIDRMYIKGNSRFIDRDLIIWDEAHLLNDLFSEHNAIFFSEKRLKYALKDIAETLPLVDLELSKMINKIANDCNKKGRITEDNYMTYLTDLMGCYSKVQALGTEQANRALRSGDMKKYTKFLRFSKKYEGLACKIDDLIIYKYDHVFDWNEEDCSVSVKPIFVNGMFDNLKGGVCNLFMSATVSGDYLERTLGLDPATTKFIKLPPTFPKENKEIIFFDAMSLSYMSLKDEATIKKLRKNVAKIVKHHIDQGQRGIILTPSFKLQEEVVAELSSQDWAKNYRIFEQRKGEKLADTLAAFKAYDRGPALMVTPSGYEGVDLPGDLSRFQIMLKAPFPSLGDKRFKFILDHYPDVYNFVTLAKVIQGAGRSVRSAEDHATTYILDANAQRLWNSSHNIWRDEFETRFTRFL